MRFVKTFFLTLLSLLVLSSCSEVARKAIDKEIQNSNQQLPVVIAEGISFDSLANVDGNLVFYYSVSKTMQDMNIGLDLNNETFLSSFVSKQISLVDKVILADMGIQTVFLDADTKEAVKVVTVENERLRSVRDKVRTGEVETPSYIEQVKLEFEKCKLPVEVSDGLFLVKQYVNDDNAICYEYVLNVDANREELEINDEDVENDRLNVLAALEQTMTLKVRKDDIKREVSKFTYIYKNTNDEELYSFSIGSEELWAE